MLCVFILCLYLKYFCVSSTFCYWNSGCPYKYFADKTPYNNVRGDIRDSIVKLKGCQPISIWSLVGTPKSTLETDYSEILSESFSIKDKVISSYASGKSSLCAQDVDNLKNWKTDNEILRPNFLSDEGALELNGIANRLQQAFPSLLRSLKDANVKLSSAAGLMEESALSFVKGLSEHITILQTKDNIIPYKTCNSYQDLLKNASFFKEVQNYKKSGDYLATKDRIQRRLGIDTLSDAGIKSLYDLCSFTWSGIENKFSPWCALFTTEDLRVLEYISDLEHYYSSGYGTPVNALLGRIPLADLLKEFTAAKEGTGMSMVTYFTDSSTLDMACTALNLFKDDTPLSGTKRNSKRKWRTSKLSVFSANLVAVLNRCENNDEIDHNVVFYLNEEPLLPICERGYCPWEEFESQLRPFVNSTMDICG